MIRVKHKIITPKTVEIGGALLPVFSFNTIVIGTGAAGFNAADTLYSLGQEDIAIITRA